ncbi:hypothetical protein L0F63_002380, partial [Massospora cicadina]
GMDMEYSSIMHYWKKAIALAILSFFKVDAQIEDGGSTPDPRTNSTRVLEPSSSGTQHGQSQSETLDRAMKDGRGRCQQTYERREIRELSWEELQNFYSALEAMKKSGVYDRICRIHLENVSFAHATPYFLPWHREFIYRFEQELRRINPRVTLPYWDWSLDAQAPERSEILSPAYFGNQGKRCLDNGPFSGWRCPQPSDHCLSRRYNGGATLSAFYSPELLRHTLDGRKTYDEFRRAIEGPPHGNVHNNIGGDMSTMASCNDPLFYLHHGFVDKLWLDWQSKDASRIMDFGGTRKDGKSVSSNDPLQPFNISVYQALDFNNDYCYKYSAGPQIPRRPSPPLRRQRRSEASGSSPGPFDREDLTHMRYPLPLSDDFIDMFGLNRTEVRKQEESDRAHVEELNASGYISALALGTNEFLLKTTDAMVNTIKAILPGDVLNGLNDVVEESKSIVTPVSDMLDNLI